jgi:RNA 2',3'-cyclic 3'-phosphodiesterase
VRLFVAVMLPERLAAVLRAAVATTPELRPTTPASLHVTVHFLGAVEPGAVAELTAALAGACAAVEPFALRFEQVAPAPPRRPRMLWARAQPSSAYAALAEAVAAASAPFAPEAGELRPGSPHVTLARLRGRRPPRAWPGPVPLDAATLDVSECVLVRSQLHAAGARHTALEVLRLGHPAGRR